MGVPKFYRWVSERYPCLSQVIQEHQIPDFDNLYLDMNGIIHPCSHPNDDDPHFRKSEEDIFADIFHYIEVLFRIIKPKKVFFMAVDGVAPRAKMNQQRGRRFRSAKEAENNIRKALEKGQVLPKEERFDSNCITPGTPFMVRLHEQLKFFVNYKISTDLAWQGLRIYLSGHETPGEGEHKIMEFIRSEKVRPDYDPNTRHCLYGLDADLIMLGLSTHEPHFSLLREEVRFGKASKRITKPEKTTFHLLHLSLFREYLDWEFNELKDTLPFPYDLERIIDDWILMGFLVGNDFIPHLPNLHINHDALPYLYRVYVDVMPSQDGYLHDNGKLILPRFEKYLIALSKFDREQFEEKFVDMKWFESKKGFTFGNNPVKAQEDDSLLTLENSFAALELMPGDSVKAKAPNRKLNPELEKLAQRFDDELSDDDGDEEDVFETEFAMFKRDYYMQKLGYEEINRDVLAEQTFQYVMGIQWILFYYFRGVPSWSWFYPFHYAPYMSDIRNFSELSIKFELGTPFLPFEQLLAVLPAASRQLLPKPFQNLMIMEQSEIIEYYPVNFKTDLNGKQQEWEAVVLIPFIDERKLLDTMSPLYSRLTEEELNRNKHGPCLLYTFDPNLSISIPSTLPGKFPDVSFCKARCEVLDKDIFKVDNQHLCQGLCEGVKLDVYFPGFPTLYHVAHKAELKKASVKVFQMHSKGKSMMLQINQPEEEVSAAEVAKGLLGETCYVGWPHMVEALVLGACDGTKKYTVEKKSLQNSSKEIKEHELTEVEFKSWKHQVKSMIDHHLERRGIELGETNVLIEACPIRGKRYVCGAKGLVTMEKEWSPMPIAYPHQLTVKDIHVHETHEDDKIHTIEELFPVGSQRFMLASPYYGSSGEVIEIDVKQSRIRVQLHVPPEPDLSPIINQHQALSLNYLPAHIVAKKLGITTNLLSRITGSFFVTQGSSKDTSGSKLDIGLNMKFSKQNKEVLGFARRTEEGSWTFSPTAQKTIAAYLKKFPQLFESLAKMCSNNQSFYAGDLIQDGNGSAPLSEVQDWLKTVPTLNLEPVKCGNISLDEPVVEAIEEAVRLAKESNQKPKTVKVRVRPHLLFRPSEHRGAIPPDSDATFQLFDRVINVKLNVAVPFGLRGTVTGIHQGDDDSEVMYEVVFDEPFLGGQPLRCSSNKVYLMSASSLINISHGDRCEAKKGEEKSGVRGQQQAGGASTPGRLPFSPSLGSSPELGRKNKNGKYRSPDVKLESSGAPGFGRGMMPNSSYGGGFGSPNDVNARDSPSQIKTRANSDTNKTKQRTPVIQTRGTPQAQINTNKATESSSDELSSTPASSQKVDEASNSVREFADMWKELKLKETSPPHDATDSAGKTSAQETEDTLIKEGTQALREMLQIGQKPAEKEQTKPELSVRGRQLSLDELFRSQSSSQVAAQSVPPLSLPYPTGSLPTLALLRWSHSVGMPPPYYHYSPTPQGVIAIVQLASGFKFPGSVCQDNGEAAESAASVALFQLPRILAMQQHHFAPGFFSVPHHPTGPPAFANFAARFPPKQQGIQQQSPQPRPNTGRGRTNSMTEKDHTSPSLSASAQPFIPLQVTRRSHQSSPTKPQKAESQEMSSSGQSTEELKQVQSQQQEETQTHDQHQNAPGNTTPRAVPSQRTDKNGPFKKPTNSSKRLLAPSFFSKKS